MKYINYVRERFSKDDFPAFSVADVKSALKNRSVSDQYVRLMLHNLKSKGVIKPITRGIYTFQDDIAVVGFAFQPFYYGLECALSIRGISEQGTNVAVMTPRNVRAGMRAFEGRNYRIKRVDNELMFGFDLIRYGKFWVPVSDVEKTVIDMLYFKDHIRDELWSALASRIELDRLKEYLKRYDYTFSKNALAVVLEHARKRDGKKFSVSTLKAQH